ncbi:MAG: hypothetical protein M0Z71_03560 [Nitrospiraceae bacterium]|nr:hypothetical protein [Nitrospiraceae bacterium]
MAVIESLDAEEFYPFLRKLMLDEFGDGFYLCGAFPGTYDKVIGDDGESGEIKDNEINGLLAEGRFCCLDG